MEKLVFEEKFPLRLDVFLTREFDYSRNFFHHIIGRGAVLVNGKKSKKSYKLKNGDQIQIESLDRFLSEEILDEAPDIDLEVLLEKEDYLVVYKPKGVLSHPGSVWDISSPSVVGFLYHRYKSLPTIGNFIRAGLIHRLDKNTDGLMIIVKSEKGLSYFKDLFQKKSLSKTIEEKESIKLKKYYKAKVTINDKGKQFIFQIDKFPYIIDELVKTKGVYLREFKNGITKILSIDIIGNDEALIDIEILTGRTHQIRYHLSSHGLPILGDDLYGGKKADAMQLSSYRLEFEDLYGEYIILEK